MVKPEHPGHDVAESPAKDAKETRIKKRKYSRGGCDECKRRKMKCDEGKPFCYNCTRLKKICVYSKNKKFRFDKDSETDGRPTESVAGPLVGSSREDGMAVRFYNPNGNYSNEFVDVTPGFPRHEATFPVHNGSNPAEHQPHTAHPPAAPQYGHPPPKVPFKNTIPDILSNSIASTLATPKAEMLNLFDKASLLVNDINDLVSLDVPNEYLLGTDPDYQGERSLQSEIQPIEGEAPSKDPSVRSIYSDTFEKHDFKLDDLTNQIIGNRRKLSPVDLNSPFNPSTPDVVLNDFDSAIKNSDLITQVVQKNKLTEPHITYLNTLTKTQLSYHIFPFASSIESNQVMRLLLQYSIDCPYLLTSLLVISATFQYNQSGKKVHDFSRKKYISVCLRSLSEVFKGGGGQSNGFVPNLNHYLKNDIEKLLLTILVLTSNFTATAHQDTKKSQIMNSWKVHLRGAKDLLTKYNSLKMTQDKAYVSGGLTLAKTWFYAMETIATMNTTLGGTLRRNIRSKSECAESNKQSSDGNLEEMGAKLTPPAIDKDLDDNFRVLVDTGFFYRDLNPEYHDALVKIGLLIPASHPLSSPYNLFLGYSMKIVELSHEVSHALSMLRAGDCTQISSTKVSKIMSMIYEARNTEIIPGINKSTCLIPQTSPGHPEFVGNRMEFPRASYSKIVDYNGQAHFYSWLDLSEQIRVDTIYLRLLTMKGLMKLPRPHPLIDELKNRALDLAFIIRDKNRPDYLVHKEDILVETQNFYLMKSVFDCRASMLQSAFRVCCNLVDDERTFEMIEIYYLGLVKLGNGSSLGALDALYKNRERVRKRVAGDDVDSGDDVEELENIPFA